ncbi:hypothetical protein OHB41_25475 [Streptomyces sp. NBC_01571]|uniref:hypothetical protein n=1 Tax=Streptomyces sp. NBC_01571 TaxID=2975883 RepID=UPI00225012EF|nr:hypothetical protein [Streptomyces sp. NBC_01571]MCX4576465.1 hypothetical protein [Streptomyces sp. NBC_01571]
MSEHEDLRRRDEERHPEHEHKQSHAGNGTVNHGPDGQPDEQGPAELGSENLGPDELALRRLLHQAVEEIEPTDGTLEHLRRAVPARRARKRQALVGMAAAALFIGTAVPALVHVSNASGSNADPSIAGNSSQAQGGTSQGKNPDGGESTAGGGSGTSNDHGKQGRTGAPDKGKEASTGAATGGPDPSASAPTALACTPAQLGGATSTVGVPDSTGAVYGSFSVSNSSGTSCTVSGAGAVSTLAQGAADPSKISVVTHVAGDAATGLPNPSTEVASLVLQPGASYVVKFAWVPSETCPTTGGGEPSPDPSSTEEATTAGGTGTDTGGTGTSAQLLTEDGVADGSVTLSYATDTGATASTTVSGACAGTVYRTGILAAS